MEMGSGGGEIKFPRESASLCVDYEIGADFGDSALLVYPLLRPVSMDSFQNGPDH
jgi:hypothetical protein